MRVIVLAGVRIAVRFHPRQWKGEAPRVVEVYRVSDAGSLEHLQIDPWPGTNDPAVHLGSSGWVLLGDLIRLEYSDWEPPRSADAEALEGWLQLYPKLLSDGYP